MCETADESSSFIFIVYARAILNEKRKLADQKKYSKLAPRWRARKTNVHKNRSESENKSICWLNSLCLQTHIMSTYVKVKLEQFPCENERMNVNLAWRAFQELFIENVKLRQERERKDWEFLICSLAIRYELVVTSFTNKPPGNLILWRI